MKRKVLLFSALALAFSSMAQSENRESTDLVIIGAGGAGMSAAIEAHNGFVE
ncbi:FAD-binding protein [Symbiopectobacterium purcellii]|uniref:FAD-binding protein n=1 Tax=Symbiopectobacterium purcellii TaxID=2871826 RepID=UPI003F84674A